MKIEFIKEEGSLQISPDGRLDTTTAPTLEAFLAENYNGKDTLLIDCEKLAYVSSAGLRVLLAAQKKSMGKMKLIHVCELVMEVFEITGFSDILTIE